eukprot:5193565-Amphidinium_carterae.1
MQKTRRKWGSKGCIQEAGPFININTEGKRQPRARTFEVNLNGTQTYEHMDECMSKHTGKHIDNLTQIRTITKGDLNEIAHSLRPTGSEK